METNDKLREALEQIANICDGADTGGLTERTAIYNIAKAALARPPRNCEVGTEEEQQRRFDAFCDAHKYVGDDGSNMCSRTCPCFKSPIDCGEIWDQMPYEEGGDK